MIAIQRILIVAALLFGLFSGQALAQAGQKEDGSNKGVITIDQLTKGLEPRYAERFGIVVHFVLPKGWEVVEQGIDPKSGEMKADLPKYVLLSRRPMNDPKEPTDFIFELNIFKQQMDISKLPKGASDQEIRDALGAQLTEFLNVDISNNIKAGMEMESKVRDIEAKEYRKGTFFIPVRYTSPEGTKLFTFTSFEGTTVYQLKFLVSEDMVEQHGMLIALMLKNSFALTKAMHDELLKQTGAKTGPPPAKPAPK